MGAYNVINRSAMAGGQPENIGDVLANFDALATLLNGNLDDFNIKAAANIAIAKLAAGAGGQVLGMVAGVPTWVGGVEKIQEQTLGGAQATIDFPGIPNTFKHLMIISELIHDTIAITAVAYKLNNDGGANYDQVYMQGNGGAAASAQALGNNFMNIGGTGLSARFANTFLLHDYTNPTFYKLADSSYYGSNGSGGVADQYVNRSGARWKSAAVVNRITLSTPAGGLFAAGSYAGLYGVG